MHPYQVSRVRCFAVLRTPLFIPLPRSLACPLPCRLCPTVGEPAAGLGANHGADGLHLASLGAFQRRLQVRRHLDQHANPGAIYRLCRVEHDPVVRHVRPVERQQIADALGRLVGEVDQRHDRRAYSGAQDFPYANIRGATSDFGLAAPWSLVKFNDSLAGLMKNRMGQVQVMMAVGHRLQKISSQELDSIINGYVSVADATAFSYLLGGHPMYQINFPAAGKSWLFDGSTQMWSPMETGLDGQRHLAEICVDYLNKPRVTDYANGNVYILDPNVYTDNGMPIARELVGKHLLKDYDKSEVFRLQVDLETGVGLVLGQGASHAAGVEGQRAHVGQRDVDDDGPDRHVSRARGVAPPRYRTRLAVQVPHYRPGEGGHHGRVCRRDAEL